MSTETDRELLELAAKAAGLELSEYQSSDASAPLWLDRKHANPVTHSRDWNPLTDDGDALRLAVKRRIEFYFAENDGVMVCVAGYAASDGRIRYVIEPLGDDENASTRRCIVMAVAEIGRQ